MKIVVEKNKWLFLKCFFRVTILLRLISTAQSFENDDATSEKFFQHAVSDGESENPGAQLIVNELGVQYAFNLAGVVLNNEIMNLNITDIVETFDDGFINISNLRITAYNPPQFKKQLKSPNTLTWGLVGAGINVESNWKGSKKVGFQVNGEGTFRAKARRLGISVSVDASSTADGRPVLTNAKCESNLGKIQLYIKGGLTGFLLNAFRNLILAMLKPILETKICEIAVNFVKTDINSKLASFPPKVKILDGVYLYLALSNRPFLSTDTIQTNHSCRVTSLAANSTPFEPRDLDPFSESVSEKMVSLLVTDYVANALLYHIYSSDYFHIEIDPGTFGRVSCSIIKGEICLGSIFGDLGKHYPETSVVHILMRATSVPYAFFVQNKTIVYGRGEILLKVYNNQDVNETDIFLNVRINLVAEIYSAYIENSTLYSFLNLTSLNMETSADDEKIAPDLWSAFVAFIRPMLQNILRNMFKNGFHLNLIDGVTFHNGRVEFQNRTMLIEADVNYYHELKPGFIMPDSGPKMSFAPYNLFITFLVYLFRA